MNSAHGSRYWQLSRGVKNVQVRNDTVNCEKQGIYQSFVFSPGLQWSFLEKIVDFRDITGVSVKIKTLAELAELCSLELRYPGAQTPVAAEYLYQRSTRW